MSIEKQYYTPKLKEFTDGFRYEHYIPIQEAWAKERFYLNSSHINIVKYVDIQTEDTLLKVRVKSLDHDDIIEAGWELIEDGKHIVEFMIKGSNEDTNIYLTYRTESEFIEIHNNGDNIEDHIYYFQGTVKNYNKLLDVMEMLGIKANS